LRPRADARGDGPFELHARALLYDMRRLTASKSLACATLLSCGIVALPPDGLAHGDLHERISLATQAIQKDTNNAALFLARGELYREHEDWPAATSDFDRAEKLNPQLAEVDFCRAQLLTDSGALTAARAKFDQYLTRVPTDGRALVARARLLARIGERRLAVEDYTRALAQLREPQPDYFLERARLQAADGDVEAALKGLDEGVKALGAILTFELYAMELELGRGRHDAALARLDIVMQQTPRKENWLARRADILLAAGRSAEARDAYQAALAAVATLPVRFQGSEAMMQLTNRVTLALNALTNAPSSTARETGLKSQIPQAKPDGR
jgi:tetratricopeptide (TPR) repeat protein